MNTITVSIPKRLQDGSLPIKNWIEAYAKSVNLPFTVVVGGEGDEPNRVGLEGAGTLTQAEYNAAIIAVEKLNDRLNHSRDRDVWKANNESSRELVEHSDEIDRIFDAIRPKP